MGLDNPEDTDNHGKKLRTRTYLGALREAGGESHRSLGDVMP